MCCGPELAKVSMCCKMPLAIPIEIHLGSDNPLTTACR